MTPGSREWVVRSLRDWALGIGQGMALVTYRSILVGYEVVGTVTRELEGRGLTCSTMLCNTRTGPQPLIRDVAANRSDVLFVFDVDRLLFGDNDDQSPFWINFHRETLTAHPGAQIWWMSPKGAIRFGQSLPDLARFFLFREALEEEAEAVRPPAGTRESRSSEPARAGNETRAEDLLSRALKSARSGRAEPARIWLELALPAISEFLKLREPERAIAAFSQVSALVGKPEDALESIAAEKEVEESRREDVALGFSTLSLVASEMGHWGRALELGEKAVATCRKLVEERRDAYLPDLAASLNNLANFLGELGRRDEALHRGEEAVAVYRELASERGKAYLPGLTSSITNLANILSDLGNRDKALGFAEEAVAMYRILTAQQREVYLPYLAGSLNNLSNRLSALGRRDEALERVNEAVAIRRDLAATRREAFLPDLAASVNNLANRLSELGLREEALGRGREAVALYRELTKKRSNTFAPELSRSLGSLAWITSEEDPGAAVQLSEEAIEILTPFLLRFPQVYKPLMERLVAGYEHAASRTPGANVNLRLLAPVFPLLVEVHPDPPQQPN